MNDQVRTARYSTGRWALELQQTLITYETDHPDADPHWRHTDGAGHPHHYERAGEPYPTLRYVIDAEHWCDGVSEGWEEHDPHMHVDESHYECLICGEHIKPGQRPPGHRSIPGTTSVELTGPLGYETVTCVAVDQETYEGLRDLHRRLRMTSTSAIQDRLCEQWVEQHPQAVVERQSRGGW